MSLSRVSQSAAPHGRHPSSGFYVRTSRLYPHSTGRLYSSSQARALSACCANPAWPAATSPHLVGTRASLLSAQRERRSSHQQPIHQALLVGRGSVLSVASGSFACLLTAPDASPASADPSIGSRLTGIDLGMSVRICSLNWTGSLSQFRTAKCRLKAVVTAAHKSLNSGWH